MHKIKYEVRIINLSQDLCGTESHPVRFRAKKYKVQEKSFSMGDFQDMMTHLPEPVSDRDIMDMFTFADKDKDGRISWEEFLVTQIVNFSSQSNCRCRL